MRILIVGAGALGSVFGNILAQGGAEIFYLVRSEKSRPKAAVRIAELRRWRSPRIASFRPAGSFTTVDAISGNWDAVWLCTHSTVLHDSWLSDLKAKVGKASVVAIGMGVGDRAALEKVWPAQSIVEVFPSILAMPPGVAEQAVGKADFAYWVVPGPIAVSGPQTRGDAVARSLTAGGLSAKYKADGTGAILTSAVNVPTAAAAELAGWKLDGGRYKALGLAAAREATQISAAQLGQLRPRLPTAISLALGNILFSAAAPFDTMRFTQANYEKVAQQTLAMLDEWIEAGDLRSIPTESLKRLRRLLFEHRSGTASRQ